MERLHLPKMELLLELAGNFICFPPISYEKSFSFGGLTFQKKSVVADGFIQAVPFTARSRTHVLKYLFCDDVYGLVEEEFVSGSFFLFFFKYIYSTITIFFFLDSKHHVL